jgi:hypothetical protein
MAVAALEASTVLVSSGPSDAAAVPAGVALPALGVAVVVEHAAKLSVTSAEKNRRERSRRLTSLESVRHRRTWRSAALECRA